MKKLKICLLAITLFTGLLNHANAAGIPVIDLANIAQSAAQVRNIIKQARDNINFYKNSLNNYKDIISNGKSQLEALTGISDFRDILREFESLKNDFKINPSAMVSDLMSGINFKDLLNGKGNLSGSIVSSLPTTQRKVFDDMTKDKCNTPNQKVNNMCAAQILISTDGIQKQTERALQMKKITESFEKLIKTASKAKDLKESIDITNQILILQIQMELETKEFERIIEETSYKMSEASLRLERSQHPFSK